jgi:hypothetical protein
MNDNRNNLMRNLAAGLFLISLVTISSCNTTCAADISRGQSFSDGQRITASQLQNLVDNATIVPGFYTTKPVNSSLAGADIVLIYSPSLAAYRQITANSFLYQNPVIITGQTEKSTVATNDYLLLYDAAAGVLKKLAVGTLDVGGTNVIVGQPTIYSNLNANAVIWVVNNGTNGSTTISNALLGFNYMAASTVSPFALLAEHAAPTNADQLLIWSSVNSSNRFVTLSGLQTNGVVVTNIGSGDLFQFYSFGTATNGATNAEAVIDFNSLSNLVVNHAESKLPKTFVSAEYPIPSVDNGGVTNIAHGLAGVPQSVRWVIVAKTNSVNGLTAGDEVDVNAVFDSGGSAPAWVYGGNATNVFIGFSKAASMQNKTNSSFAAVDTLRCKIKSYAVYYP